jgi:hypothetical protein
MKKGLLLIALIILILIIAFKILSLQSDWAVAIFILLIISLIYLTQKQIKNYD